MGWERNKAMYACLQAGLTLGMMCVLEVFGRYGFVVQEEWKSERAYRARSLKAYIIVEGKRESALGLYFLFSWLGSKLKEWRIFFFGKKRRNKGEEESLYL